MREFYLVDVNSDIYRKSDCEKCGVRYAAPEDAASLTGYLIINADNCGDVEINTDCAVGLLLLSGDTGRVCDTLLNRADNIFCSISSFCDFLHGNDIWNKGLFLTARNNAELLLRYIGMDEKLSGFSYMSFLIAYLTFSEGATLKYDIFPVMEKHFKKTVQCMERAMRYAVEVTWSRGDIFAQESVFGYTVSPERGKPVALELAAMLSERIRDEILYDRD